MAVSQLDPMVEQLADPQGRGRQYLATRLANLAGTRIAGFVLTRQEAVGRWGKATYALKKTAEDGDHRGHRGHRGESQAHEHANGANVHAAEGSDNPYDPYDPYAFPSRTANAIGEIGTDCLEDDGYECRSRTQVGTCRWHSRAY